MSHPPDQRAILVLDDEPASVELLQITLGLEFRGFTATDGARALEVLRDHPEIALAIVDQRMPGMTGTEFIKRTIEPFPRLVRVILTGYTDVESLIEAINAGQIFRYLTKPWERNDLFATVRQGLEVHRLAVENDRLQEELRHANARLAAENVELKREVHGRYRFDNIVGNSPAIQRMLHLVERVVPTSATVLITGETGTGKEEVARAIHYNGPRGDKSFVSENFAALPKELLSSVLFGHRRGSFTGAISDHTGLFEVANGGTLFIDEIGDCPPELQVQLLRVLQEGEIRRIGDTKKTRVNVRVIAATHRDLHKDVADGRFREDLYYRLKVVEIRVPALRERKEDIPMLVEHILGRLRSEGRTTATGFTRDALAVLARHDFPGNVRELVNEVERAAVMAHPEVVVTPDLLSDRFADAASSLPPALADGSLRAALERFENDFLRDALLARGGNQTRTADELGIARRTLIDKMQKYGIR